MLVLAASLTYCGGDEKGPTAPSTPPSAPTNVRATAQMGAVRVEWDGSRYATSYNVYFKMGLGATIADTLIAGVASPFTHDSLANGKRYSYVVTAVNGWGESDPSAEVAARPGLPPLYVSASTGSDDNDGSREHPVLTLAKAYSIADTAGQFLVMMEAGEYAEAPQLRVGIDVEGGYGLPGWTVGTDPTVFDLGTSRAEAQDIVSPTVISNVEFRASDQTGRSNSIALYVSSCDTSLHFVSCRFLAARAGSGANGANGAKGQDGGAGGFGYPGTCDHGNGVGGGGGSSAVCPGGAGGDGGPEGEFDGKDGIRGSCMGGLPGIGGAGHENFEGYPGTNGEPGDSLQVSGADGAAATAAGETVAGEWRPQFSGDGQNGSNGSGGGGGGGGGGQGGTWMDDGGGNGGGGGGGGGQGGTGGGGGEGGYGSFGVFLYNATPTFESCYFQSSTGGKGGDGGSGGERGRGGDGGVGGTVCTSEIGAGGNGGYGGHGGGGGAGAGGPGGPSFCIYEVLSSPILKDASFLVGSPGSSGIGGLRRFPSSGQAPSGPTGLSGWMN